MLRLLTQWLPGKTLQRQPSAAKSRRRKTRLHLEHLEERTAPAVFNVNSTLDILSPAKGVVTLRSAIESANATPGGNTINLTAVGTYKITAAGAGEDNNATGDFDILSSGGNLTVVNTSGGNVTVDGNHLDRVFDINPANTNNPATAILVTMKGFTIKNGIAQPGSGTGGSGGGIRVQGNAGLTLNTMTITSNSATGDGGGISNSGNGTVGIDNSTVQNNSAGTTGGGFGDQNSLGTLGVWGSLFLANSALGDGGGINASGPRTVISFSIFQGNSSGGNGGGIAVGGTTPYMNSSTFFGNKSAGNGGGIEIDAVITGASGSSIVNCTICGNSAMNNGGGIDTGTGFTSTVILLNDTINANLATSGGGSYWAGSGTVTVQNTILAANSANTGPDVSTNKLAGTFTDLGGNLVGVSGTGSGNTEFTNGTTQTGTVAKPLNPLLGALQNNGGNTDPPVSAITVPTEALLPGSPAINKGVASAAPFYDAREVYRPVYGTDGTADVGAFEFQNAMLSVTVAQVNPTLMLNQTATFTITVQDTGTGFLPVDHSTLTVSLSPGFTAVNGSPLTFVLGEIVQGQSATFTVHATAAAAGPQTISAVVTSPDANPNSVSASLGSVVLTAQQHFIQALYFDDLHRVGSLAELNSWVTILNGPGGSLAVVARAIVQSFEYRDNLVKSWYLTYLGRPARGGEELMWVNMMPAQSQEVVLTKILASSEFYNRAQKLSPGGTADANWIGAIYQLVLNRTASAAEIAHQAAQLTSLNRLKLALNILQSQEYRGDLVAGYYKLLLHRAPDAGGFNFWISTKLDAAAIFIMFESSSEFYANG